MTSQLVATDLLHGDVGAAAGDGRAGDGDEPGEERREADQQRHDELGDVLRHQLAALVAVEDVVTLATQRKHVVRYRASLRLRETTSFTQRKNVVVNCFAV